MEKDFHLMHLKISISSSGAMAKCTCYVAVRETEELTRYSDSKEKCVSDASDVKAVDDLPEDSDNSVPEDQFWRDSRSEDGAKIYPFSAPKPGMNCHAAPYISADSSPLDCLRLMFTDEL
jgi:hypothetical protein